MEDKKESKLRVLLKDVDKEFQGFNHIQQVKFAIRQISSWQQKLNEAKQKIPEEKIINTVSGSKIPA